VLMYIPSSKNVNSPKNKRRIDAFLLSLLESPALGPRRVYIVYSVIDLSRFNLTKNIHRVLRIGNCSFKRERCNLICNVGLSRFRTSEENNVYGAIGLSRLRAALRHSRFENEECLYHIMFCALGLSRF